MGFIDRANALLGRRPKPMTPDEALGRSEELDRNGQPFEAVELLRREARRTGDARLLKALTTQRRRAAETAEAQARPRADWPPEFPDPFPGLIGIPEIERHALSTEMMGGAILHHGSVLVRGLLSREEAGAFAGQIDDLFADYDAWAAGTPREGSPLIPMEIDESEPLGPTRPWNREGGGIWAADCPALLDRLLHLYDRHGLIAAIEGYLGERPVISVGKTVLRRVDPTHPGDFHQDGAFLGRNVRTINAWIALSDCGVDSPGLEVVDRRLPGIVETGTGDAIFDWSVGRNVAREANDGRPFARPAFKAGDALIFDQLMLHATSYGPAMDRRRFALESWFFAPSAAAPEQIPLVI